MRWGKSALLFYTYFYFFHHLPSSIMSFTDGTLDGEGASDGQPSVTFPLLQHTPRYPEKVSGSQKPLPSICTYL